MGKYNKLEYQYEKIFVLKEFKECLMTLFFVGVDQITAADGAAKKLGLKGGKNKRMVGNCWCTR